MALHAARTRADEKSHEIAFTVWTDDDTARLTALIATELNRHYAKPLARRALSLIAESAIEPTPDGLGYRIVDRHGDPRYRRLDDDDSATGKATPPDDDEAGDDPVDRIPLTLGEYVKELRARHPSLFDEPPPEPEPESDAKPSSRSLQETMGQVKAAGTRFVGMQSALARSVAHGSAERGLALASSASKSLQSLRSRVGETFRAKSEPAQAALPLAQPEMTVAAPAAEIVPKRPDAIAAPSRPPVLLVIRDQFGDGIAGKHAAMAALGVFVVAGLVTTALLLPRQAETPVSPVSGAPSSESTQTPPPATSEPAAPSMEPGSKASTSPTPVPNGAPSESSPPSDPELQPAEPGDEPPLPANALSGVPEVIDTATLKLGGRVVQLFGVEWVRGGVADDLRRYLASRSVTCQPAAGSKAFLCTVEGRDLSEVVLFNGGGRASPEATPELVAAEDHARSERLGVWKR